MARKNSARGSVIGRFLIRVIGILLFAGLCALLYAMYGKSDDPQTRAQLEDLRTGLRSRTSEVGRNLNSLNERLGEWYAELQGADGETTSVLKVRVGEMRDRLSALQEQVGDLTSQEKWQEYRKALEDLYRVASMSLPSNADASPHPAAQGFLSDLRRLIQEASPTAVPEEEEGDGAASELPAFGGER